MLYANAWTGFLYHRNRLCVTCSATVNVNIVGEQIEIVTTNRVTLAGDGSLRLVNTQSSSASTAKAGDVCVVVRHRSCLLCSENWCRVMGPH